MIRIILISVAAFLLLFSLFVNAQTAPSLIVTWQAENYAPSGYEGVILPTRGTAVRAALALIDAGKIQDLSKKEIRWFTGRELIKSGLGAVEIEFRTPELATGDIALKAVVRNYKNADWEGLTAVPVAEPEIVIDAPYPERKIAAGLNVFKALPYFFNINDVIQLVFSWTANGLKAESGSEEPDRLNLETSLGRSGDEVNLSVAVLNSLNPLQFASQSLNLTIK